MVDRNPTFTISEVTTFGDSANGESYQVKVTHDCPKDPINTQNIVIGFGRASRDEKIVTCQTCGHDARVHKNLSGDRIIYIAED